MALEAVIKDLKEKRAAAFEQAKALLEAAAGEKRDLTAEENQKYTAINADIDSLGKRAEQVEQLLADEKALDETFRKLDETPVEQRRDPAGAGDDSELRKWVSGQNPAPHFDVRSTRPMGTQEFRALSKLTAGAGANTVKVSFYDQLMAHLIDVAGLMQAGPTVLQTTTGEQIQVPKTTAHSTAALIAEAGTITSSDPAFGQVPLDAYKYATLFQVSSELLNDTSIDLEGYLAMQAGRALGNALGAHLITGTGTSQPNGVITAATTGVTGGAGVTGAFTADNLIDLFFSVIAPYRNSPSAAWLLKDSTLAAVRKLKDSTNQYLWQPSLQVGVPDTLLGKPTVTDPNVAAPALSAASVAFGDFSQYFVRLVNGIRFERSVDYAFNTDLVTFRAILRGDGDLVDTTGAVKKFVGNAA